MKRTRILLVGLMVLCFMAIGVSAQQTNIVKTPLSQAEIDRIVKNFTAKEAEFRDALREYVFNRNATIQTIGMGGQVTGVYRRDSFMALNEQGRRAEKIVYFPVPTIKEVAITPEDIENLGSINPFALEPSKAVLYNFTFVGKEKIDELDLYVFDVAPKVLPDPKKSKELLFLGRIWVDDHDLQIVRSKGKAVPEDKNNKYPIIETWRENVGGKYWFPSYATSDDELVFDSGQAVKLKIRVRYKDYTQGKSEVKILDDTEETPTPTPTPTPKKP